MFRRTEYPSERIQAPLGAAGLFLELGHEWVSIVRTTQKKMGIAEASPNFCTGSVTQVTEVTHFSKTQDDEMRSTRFSGSGVAKRELVSDKNTIEKGWSTE